MVDSSSWYSIASTNEEIDATREGFARAFSRSPVDDYSVDDMIEDAKQGHLIIVTCHENKAAMCLYADTQKSTLLVVAAYSFIHSPELVSQVFVMLEELAVLMSCKRVTFDSERLGWQRVAPRFGYLRMDKQFFKQVA